MHFCSKDQLRDEWKFNGYVVSDCDAVADIFNGHQFTKSMAEARQFGEERAWTTSAPTSSRMHDNIRLREHFIDAVKQGLLTEKEIDVSLRRLFTARFRLGMFDPPEMVQYAQTPNRKSTATRIAQLALEDCA